jgi:nucleoside-diphosphate-sugar epimerase
VTLSANGRIAVSGANGFIGQHLCSHLLAQGCEVLAMTRRQTSRDIAGRTNVVLDLMNVDDSSRILDGCDAVIHLAGRAHVLNDTASDPLSEFRKANVTATLNLLRLASRCGVRRFVFVSSIGVNGNRTQGRAFTETDKEDPHDLYAASKLEAEQEIRRYAQQSGIEFVIVRPTLVYGPNAPGNFALLLKLASTNIPLPFGKISARRNLVSVWNLADLLYRCATHPAAAGEVFLAADREALTLKEIFTYLRAGMNKRPWIFDFPAVWLAKIAGMSGKIRMFEKLTGELCADSTKATTILGWQAPYTAYEALERTGKEYREKRR